MDDLDKIAPAEGDEGAGAFNAQAARIAERLEDLLAQGGFERAKRAPVYVYNRVCLPSITELEISFVVHLSKSRNAPRSVGETLFLESTALTG